MAQPATFLTLKSTKCPVQDEDRLSMNTVCTLDPRLKSGELALPYRLNFRTGKIPQTSAVIILKRPLAFYCFQEHKCDEKTIDTITHEPRKSRSLIRNTLKFLLKDFERFKTQEESGNLSKDFLSHDHSLMQNLIKLFKNS